MLLQTESLGGNYYNCSPIYFSVEDSKTIGECHHFIFCALGSVVKVVIASSGEILGNFSGHKTTVTAVALYPSMTDTVDVQGLKFPYVCSASCDGTIYSWRAILDETKQLCFQIRGEWKVQHPPLYIFCPNQNYLFSKNESTLQNRDEKQLSKRAIKRNAKFQSLITTPPLLAFYGVAVSRPTEKDGRKEQHDKFFLREYVLHSNSEGNSSAICEMSPFNSAHCVTGIELNSADEVDSSVEYMVVATRTMVGLQRVSNSPRWPQKLLYSTSARSDWATCVAANSQRGLVVTGYRNGEILVWRNVWGWIRSKMASSPSHSASAEAPPCSSIHWHAHPVLSMSVSLDGLSLVSGGQEAVLVLWRLGSAEGAAGRTFLPRLGGPLLQISNIWAGLAGGLRVCVTTADNCLRAINLSTVAEDWAVKALYVAGRGEPLRQAASRWRSTIAVEPRSGQLLSNGSPGELQCFDPASRSCSATFQVVAFSRVSATESRQKLLVPSVTHFKCASFDDFGAVLMTVDVVQEDRDCPSVTTIRFWQWLPAANSYALRAEVENPHHSIHSSSLSRPVAVTDAAMSLASYRDSAAGQAPFVLCASAASDGSIKIWKGFAAKEADAAGGSSMGWLCMCSFKYRECSASGLSFSRDGSLLAAGFGNLATLWSPLTVSLKASLVGPSANDIVFSAFLEPGQHRLLGGGGEAFLAVGSLRTLSVFNLLDLQMLWTVSDIGLCSAFAAAPCEALCLPGPGDQLGWLAVACSPPAPQEKAVGAKKDLLHPVKAAGGRQEGEETTDEEAEEGEEVEGGGGRRRVDQQVLVFSPHSATPLHRSERTVRSVSSLVFLEMPGDGALAAVGGAGLALLSLPGTTPTTSAADPHLVQTPARPSLPPLALPMEPGASATDPSARHSPLPRDQPLPAKGLFHDTSSEHCSTAAVFERFLQWSLPPPPKRPLEEGAVAAAAKHPRAGDVFFSQLS
mmetsp:Transcript_30181/g.43105  ORF Transcript_30181/g.43105 Transcript_30181/m.43105 type:complete len:967 (+) Transcript_30181:21-2921(+)